MNVITIWLLVSVNSIYSSAAAGHYTVIERFPTVEDCQHVQKNLPERYASPGMTRCIQARVAR